MSKEITIQEQLYTNSNQTGLFRIQGEATHHEPPHNVVIVYQDLNDKGSAMQYMSKEEFHKTFTEIKDDTI